MQLAGHVTIEDKAIISGLSAVHQFVQIGRYSFVGGCSRVAKDVPPFIKAVGNPVKLYGLQQRRPAAQRLSRGGRARAEARVSAVLPVGAERLAGDASARETELEPFPEVEEFLQLRRGERARGGDLTALRSRIGVVGAGAWATTTCEFCATCRASGSVGFHETTAGARGAGRDELGRQGVSRSLDALLDDVRRGDDRRADAGAFRGREAPRSSAGSTSLIEKPIATTLDEADELLAIAQPNGRAGTDRTRRAVQSRRSRRAAVRERARGSSRATGSRRSIRAAPTSPSCST